MPRRKRVEIPKIEVSLHQHDLGNFLVCPQKYYISNVLGYRRYGVKVAINIGDLFAKCVYWMHKGIPIEECLAFVYKYQEPILEKATNQAQIDEAETSIIIVQAMLEGYKSHFLDVNEIKTTKFNPLGGIEGFDTTNILQIIPEYSITITEQIGNYLFRYTNRLDGKIIVDKNRLWILEIKTSSSFDEDLIIKLSTNFQINSYLKAMIKKETAFGGDANIDGVLYRYIMKPSIKQKQNETLEQYRKRLMMDYLDRPERYFKEESLYFEPSSVERFNEDMKYYFENLTQCYITNKWERRGVACDSNFGLCEYLKYCSNPTQETLDTHYYKGD